ncbi:hypothetical protein [Streptomyces monomycini]|uniref:hypothetical protein n=1 Tax=Streptomyces monomycini TaxID=371720 RepID=UPI0012FE9165|nr:hypothetical protein [Streptomyces monomycini]
MQTLIFDRRHPADLAQPLSHRVDPSAVVKYSPATPKASSTAPHKPGLSTLVNRNISSDTLRTPIAPPRCLDGNRISTVKP